MSTLVLLDAGHGEGGERSDPGAIGFNKHEADYTERVAVICCNILEKKFGIRCKITRGNHPNALHNKEHNPKNTPFWRRQDAKNIGAGMLVSIHWNASALMYPSGTEVLITDKTTANQRLANEILSKMIGSLNHYCRAKKVKGWVPKSRGVKRQGLALLRNQTIPCCLVECEFITNPTVNKLMDDDSFIWTMGYSIAYGIASYLGVVEDVNLVHLAQ